MAPLSVAETCDCTATSAKRFGRYLRARAMDTGGNGDRSTANDVGREVGGPGAGEKSGKESVASRWSPRAAPRPPNASRNYTTNAGTPLFLQARHPRRVPQA